MFMTAKNFSGTLHCLGYRNIDLAIFATDHVLDFTG